MHGPTQHIHTVIRSMHPWLCQSVRPWLPLLLQLSPQPGLGIFEPLSLSAHCPASVQGSTEPAAIFMHACNLGRCMPFLMTQAAVLPVTCNTAVSCPLCRHNVNAVVRLGYHYFAIHTFCQQEQHSVYGGGSSGGGVYTPSAYRRALANGLQGN